jgi:DNA-binding transcriptional ArsR family regulator
MPPASPDPEELSARVFTALADPNRRAILAALAQHGPSTATDLAGRLSITRQGISKHLALLTEAGLVSSTAEGGRRVRYRHRSEPIKVAQSYLATLAADWDGRLDRFAAILAEPADDHHAPTRRETDFGSSRRRR